ncbi:hypothetical protein BYT27DRAFT_7186879 [Phlegmacium glaucopus]|nr:hypothetical protein BYT27DRAFT_7186879 [Phlegmacium glaucopus]
MFSLSSNINLVSSSCFPTCYFLLPFRNQDTLGAGRHSTHTEANVLSGAPIPRQPGTETLFMWAPLDTGGFDLDDEQSWHKAL